MYGRVIAHASGHQAGIMLVDFFYQNIYSLAFVDLCLFCGDRLHTAKQAVKTVFYHICRDLIVHGCSRRTGSLGIDKCKGTVIAHFFYDV